MESKQLQLCVAVGERSLAALEKASRRASEAGDLVELRLDCLEEGEFNSGAQQLAPLLQKLSVPAIVTYRPVEQGGSSNATVDSRYNFWTRNGLPLPPHLCDLELDLVQRFSQERDSASATQLDWDRVICSHHDFDGVPAGLSQIYEALAVTPARILKIAVHANDVTDCLPIFQILERGLQDGREMIAIAMGVAGIATRVLGRSRGAFLTYAALESETGTAPGQITAGELKQVYRIEKIDRHTRVFGVMGLPVGHSVSPLMHNAAFADKGVNAVYLPFEVHDVAAFMNRMIHPRTRELDWQVGGLSVTAPHKSAVMDHLDWVDPVAKGIGAVNTIVIENGLLKGFNTDAQGLIKPLTQKVGELRGARCAVLGAGGAARATLWALRAFGADLTVFARDSEKARVLAEAFGASFDTLGKASFAGFDVVINTTPLGTAGEVESVSPAASDQLRGARLAYDLVYNPSETRFLLEAKEAGCQTLGGLAMLVAQAAEQFRLWTGVDAPDGIMWEAAEKGVARGPI
jgi:3-dehydroquinate dehydratase/shikimate dehydrogenase